MTIKNQYGINLDRREAITEDERLDGVGYNNNYGISWKKFNQLMFQVDCDHIWGTESQVKLSAPRATFYTDGSGNAFDKDDAAVTFVDDDRIKVVHDSALTSNLVLDGQGKRLEIKTDRGITIDLGADSGNSNVPYNIIVTNANKSTMHFHTNKDFEEVLSVKPSATRSEQSVIKNRTLGSQVFLNNRKIFGRKRVENLLTKTSDPYALLLDGTTGLSQNDYKDLFSEFKYKFTSSVGTAIINSTFGIPDTRGRYSRIGNGSSSISPYQHTRTSTVAFTQWPNTATNISVDLTSGSNLIVVDATAAGTQSDNLNFLQNCIGMRVTCTNSRIPDGSSNTTILGGIDITTPSAVVITMIDSVSGSANSATATATELLTISNSGNVEGSIDQDRFQGFQIGGEISGPSARYGYLAGTSARASTTASSNNSYPIYETTAQGNPAKITALNDGTNGDPRTGLQTSVIDSLEFKYYLL